MGHPAMASYPVRSMVNGRWSIVNGCPRLGRVRSPLSREGEGDGILGPPLAGTF